MYTAVATAESAERRFEPLAAVAPTHPPLQRDMGDSPAGMAELQRFRAAMEGSADAIFVIDTATAALVDVNHAACRMWGRSRDVLLAMRPEVLASTSRQAMLAAWQALIDGDLRAATVEARYGGADSEGSAADGGMPVEIRRRAVQVAGRWLIVEVARDISARLEVERAMRRQAAQHRMLARFGQLALESPPLDDLMAQAMAIVRRGLRAEFCRLLMTAPDDFTLLPIAGDGWDADWLRGRSFDVVAETQDRFILGARESVVVDDFEAESRFHRSPILLAHRVRSAVEVLICGSGGAYGVIGAYSREPADFNAESANFIQSVSNTLAAAIERQHAEDRLAHLAQYDVLTDLPNRSLYLDRLGHTLADAGRDKLPVGVLFVDIDRFKNVNDTLGHAVGDRLLVEIANRLRSTLRAGDTVARLGGDEFAVVLAHLTRAEDAGQVAQKIIQSLARPFRIDVHEVYVSASIGIGLYPIDGADADSLLKCADTAMYRAKESGRNAYQFYMPRMNEHAVSRMRLESKLRGALERGEFLLYYQPKINLVSGEISGLEALLRWRPAGGALVQPGKFITILEETGLIVAVGEWAIRTVCAQLARWRADGMSPPPVAVNLSARQFHQKQLATVIGDILAGSGIDPAWLELELTESSLMSDAVAVAQTLHEIKALGIRLAVDDFGTGYSSLAYLKRFPLDALKIDREFIGDVATNADDASIALAIINLARNLKLKVIAEGVETEAQWRFLCAHGCDEMQGYLFSRPLPVDDITAVLRGERQPTARWRSLAAARLGRLAGGSPKSRP